MAGWYSVPDSVLGLKGCNWHLVNAVVTKGKCCEAELCGLCIASIGNNFPLNYANFGSAIEVQ